MPLSARTGFFSTGTGAVDSTVAVGGVGFQPAILILWMLGTLNTTDEVIRQFCRRSIGVATSTSSRAVVGSTVLDNSPSSNGARRHRDDSVIAVPTSTAANSGRLDLASFDSDGFTLVIREVPEFNYRVQYLALAGTDITNATTGTLTQPTSAGSQGVTGVGFQPDVLLFIGADLAGALPLSSSTAANMMIGAASGNAAAEQAVWNGTTQENLATMNSAMYCRTGECIAAIPTTVDGVAARASLTSFDSDGFTLSWAEADATARRVSWLAIRGGRYRVGNVQTVADTSTDITVSGLLFPPAAALLVSSTRAESTSDTLTDDDVLSLGAATSTSNRGAEGMMDRDNVADSVVSVALETDTVYARIASAGTSLDGAMDVTAVGLDGMTFRMTNADPDAALVWYLMVGPGPAAILTPMRGVVGP